MDSLEIQDRYSKTLDENRNLRQIILLLQHKRLLLCRQILANMEALRLQDDSTVPRRVPASKRKRDDAPAAGARR
jgi:hypothetical protein